MSKETMKSNFRVVISRLAYLTPVGVENFAARTRETYPDATVEVLYDTQEVCSFCGAEWREPPQVRPGEAFGFCCAKACKETPVAAAAAWTRIVWCDAQAVQRLPFGPGDVLGNRHWPAWQEVSVLSIGPIGEAGDGRTMFFTASIQDGSVSSTGRVYDPKQPRDWVILHEAGKEAGGENL